MDSDAFPKVFKRIHAYSPIRCSDAVISQCHFVEWKHRRPECRRSVCELMWNCCWYLKSISCQKYTARRAFVHLVCVFASSREHPKNIRANLCDWKYLRIRVSVSFARTQSNCIYTSSLSLQWEWSSIEGGESAGMKRGTDGDEVIWRRNESEVIYA